MYLKLDLLFMELVMQLLELCAHFRSMVLNVLTLYFVITLSISSFFLADGLLCVEGTRALVGGGEVLLIIDDGLILLLLVPQYVYDPLVREHEEYGCEKYLNGCEDGEFGCGCQPEQKNLQRGQKGEVLQQCRHLHCQLQGGACIDGTEA